MEVYVCAIVFVCLFVCCLYVCALNGEWWKLCTLISTAVMKETTWTPLSCKNADEKSNSVALQANLIYETTMHDNYYNVTTWPMKTVTTYPMVVFLLEIPVHQKPLHRRRY